MGLRAILLKLLEVLLKHLERLILVVLSRNVGAKFAKLLKLLLRLLCRGLHVGLDALQVVVTLHLGAGISDDLGILGEKLVSVLENG